VKTLASAQGNFPSIPTTQVSRVQRVKATTEARKGVGVKVIVPTVRMGVRVEIVRTGVLRATM
jgi:hypothetical protein